MLGATVAEGCYGERFGFDGNSSRAYLGPVALTASAPPVRLIETVAVREVLATPSGATVLDFGQNLVGPCAGRSTNPPARRSPCVTRRCSRTARSVCGCCGS